MRHLSISQAWEETREILKRDGRLLTTVALAMIGLPMVIIGVVSPRGMGAGSQTLTEAVVTLIATLVAVAGQLALIRLSLSSGETVGSAIQHGLRRMPVFIAALILVGIALFIAAIPFGAVLAIAGVPIEQTAEASYNPLTVVAVLAYLALIVFVAVRLVMAAPVSSAERVGVFGVLRRSWQLTSGNWWRLFAFILIFTFGMVLVLLAIGALVGVVTRLIFGPADPMSAAALVIALVQGLLNAAVTLIFVLMLARMYAQLAGASEAQASVPSSGI